MKSLDNKTAVITGGAGGIGKTTAKRFLEEGARVLLVDYKKDDTIEVVKELDSDRVDYVLADVSLEDDVEKYTERAGEKFGQVDIFFNSAGVESENRSKGHFVCSKKRKRLMPGGYTAFCFKSKSKTSIYRR